MAAPTLYWVDGFEFRTTVAALFAAGGTNPYATSAGVAPAWDTSVKKNGAASLQLVPTVAAASRLHSIAHQSSKTGWVASFYVYIASLPASDLQLAKSDNGNTQIALTYSASAGKFQWNAVSFGPALSSATWYLVDLYLDVSANPWQLKARIDGDGSTEMTGTKAVASTTFSGSPSLGTALTTGPAASMNYDDLVMSYTLADYPIGAHSVQILKPTSDGTHNAGTNVMENQSGTDIGVASAFPLIDEVPAENSDYIKQSASGSGNYAEVIFANPSPAWGATYWCALEGEAAGVSDMLFRVTDGSGNTLLDQGGVGAVSSTTRRYSAAYLAGDPGGRRGRVGFASDVVPVPRALTFIAQAANPPGYENVDGVGAPIS